MLTSIDLQEEWINSMLDIVGNEKRFIVVYDNDTAHKMWNSLGYKKVGELIEERFIKGEYHKLIIMETFILNRHS